MNWMDSIKKYIPCNEQEQKDKEIVLKCLDVYDDLLNRANELVHMTSSGFVVNQERSKVLMVYHTIYNSWSWTGGHADGNGDLLAIAIKEAREETGIKTLRPVSAEIVSLDLLPVLGHHKKGRYVAPHLHISAAFILEGDEGEALAVKPDENSGVRWIALEELDRYVQEEHMKPVYQKITAKIPVLTGAGEKQL